MSLVDFSSMENTYVTSKIINSNNVAGGTHVPAQQIGSGRVPVVTGLKLGPVSSYLGGTQYALLWDEPPVSSNISHYNVFITGVLGGNNSPLGPYSAEMSPCYLRLTASAGTVLTFYVQTVLNNGAVSSLANSPSCTGQATAPATGGTSQSFQINAGVTLHAAFTPTDVCAFVDMQTTSALVIDMTPSPVAGQQVAIKNVGSGSSTNNLTVRGGTNGNFVIYNGGGGSNLITTLGGVQTIIFTFNPSNSTWYGV